MTQPKTMKPDARRAGRWMALALIALLLGAAGCAAELESASLNDVGEPREPGDNQGPGVNNGGFAGDDDTNNSPNNDANNDFIPEEEERFSFQAPRSSRNFVFVANTGLDTVAKIDADTLEITSIEAGDRPTLVETWREENLAVVLNEGSDEVTIIRAGDTNATDYVRNLAITPHMNALRMSPGGQFALTWFDFDRAQQDEEFRLEDVAPPLQDVNLIRLEEGAEVVYHLTVGFQVIDVSFDDEGQRAFVITRTGISVVDLEDTDRDRAIPPVPVVEQALADDLEREVAITGDGRFAFVRTAGLEGLNVVDLQTRDLTLIALSDIPTDLDIIPGEDRALAVLRRTGQLAMIELPLALEDPEAIQIIELGEEPAGLAELTPDARRALVFTSVEERRAITVVDIDSGDFQTWPLRKGVRAVAIGPDSRTAVVFHSKLPGQPITGEPEDDFIAKSFGYSVFDIDTGYAKLGITPTEAGEFAFSTDANRLYVLLNDKAADVRQVEIIDLSSFNTRSLRLGSPPEHVGIIPNDGNPRIYISQEHAVGRMTFIDEGNGQIKTVTGFELNSLIE